MAHYFNLRYRIVAIMNTDHALILMGLVGIFFGFLIGYSKGHEHGKIAGRIAYRKSQRTLEQVGR